MITTITVEIALWDDDEKKTRALLDKIRNDARVMQVTRIDQ